MLTRNWTKFDILSYLTKIMMNVTVRLMNGQLNRKSTIAHVRLALIIII